MSIKRYVMVSTTDPSVCAEPKFCLSSDVEALEQRIAELEKELWTAHYYAASNWGATSDKAKEFADKRISEFNSSIGEE